MKRFDHVAAIVLGYAEPNWTRRTVECAYNAGVGAILVLPRKDGIGPMSDIFNHGMRLLAQEFTYVWHLTNVGFGSDVLEMLLSHFDPRTAAVHPCFQSEHPHMCPSNLDGEEVPFVEWTAPLILSEAWEKAGPLDEALPYWGMDLAWSAEARRAGYNLRVCTTCELDHVYLVKKDRTEHPITTQRRNARANYDVSTEERLRYLYGPNWIEEIWPTHHFVAQGRKKIY